LADALNEFKFGCAYVPCYGGPGLGEIEKGLKGLREAMSVKNWGT
jgi:hypothetical protein